ncbi:universal stress protein [Ascidiimonas sp. W6]|uniref:universal stress protein n=1 Tax=Ascidiimonas meishanensis TaxID=3128903 RepID=UPI0030EDCE68
MKRIVIPTDFSPNAYNAIAYALQLFSEEHCSFYLLHAYSPPMPEPSNTMTSAITAKRLMEISQKSAEQGLEEVLDQIKSSFNNPNHSFEIIATYGFIKDVIDEVAENKKADLIVMGTKGASGLKEIVLGSNTARVIANSSYSLIVVPETAIYEPFKEIAFFTDYDYYFERSELKPLVDLVQQTKAELHVAHILTKGDKPIPEKELVREHLDDLIKIVKPQYHLLTDHSVEKAIHIFAQSRKTAMLCMLTQKHSFLDRLFNTHPTKNISYHTKIPMLVLRKSL